MEVQQAYNNIEKVIVQGFLIAGLSFKNHYFLLKNITDKEYENLNLYVKEDDSIYNLIYQISFCTAFVDSNNFLESRFEKIPELVRFYSKMPIIFINKVKDTIQKINTEYFESLEFLEGFCYTDKSRHLWKVFDYTNKDTYLGISGLNNVGMNSVQENWIIINKRLDEEEAYSSNLNMTFIISSSMNPKGTKEMSRNYDFHKRELDELRKDIAKYGHDKKRVKEQQEKAEWTAPIKSREDLVRELYRQMSGKKDKHDLFIDEWVKQQKAAAERIKEQAEERQRVFRAKIQEVDLSSIEDSRPISASELKKVLAQKKISKTDMVVSQPMMPFDERDEKERFLKKISATIIRPNKKD